MLGLNSLLKFKQMIFQLNKQMNKPRTLLALLFLVLFNLGSSSSIFPKHLYVYWHSTIEQASILVQMCVQKMRTACAESNWNFTILSDANLHQHIPFYYEKFLPVKDNPKHPMWKANFADLVRLAIIDQKGGMYLDVSTILFRGLGWLERLEDFPYLLLNSQLHQGQEPEAVQFTFAHYQNIAQSRHPDRGITNIEPGYESWCYIAKAKSPYMSALRQRFSHHYMHTEQQNNKQELDKDYYNRGIYSDYLKIHKATFELIQQTQFELDKNLTLFGQRTNVNHHFKLVGIRSEYGPFSFLINLVPMEKVFTHTLEQIYQQDYIPMYFFLKLTSQDRPYVDQQLKLLLEVAQQYTNITKDFDSFLQSSPSIDKCQKLKFIVEGSVMGILVKNNKLAIANNIFPITLEQRQKWWDYCKLNYNIGTDFSLSPDGRMSQIIYKWVMPYTHVFLSQQTNSKLLIWLNKIAVLCAYSTHGFWGGFSDVQETLYWQKVFQKRNPHIKNPTPNPDNQYVPGKPLDDYSFFQLLQLRIKLYITANRTTLAYKLKIFNYYLFFTCLLAFIFSTSTTIVKAFFFEIKPNHSLAAVLWRFATKRNQRLTICKQIKEMLTKIISKLKNNLSIIFANVKSQKPLNVFLSSASLTLKYIVKKFLILMLCLAFLAYNAIVSFKYYYVIYFGQIYDQQLTLLLFIVAQIIFRKAFERMGKDQWALPGLTLGQLQCIFAPVYAFSLGASLLVMAERTQIRNLALSALLCMILPVLVKELDLQLKKNIKLFNLAQISQKISNPHLATATSVTMKILNNFASSCEITVMVFLGMNVILPNLRFIVYNNEVYAVKKLFHSLEGLLTLFIVMLFVLFSAQIFKKVLKITKSIQSLKMTTKEVKTKDSYHNQYNQVENTTNTQNEHFLSDSVDGQQNGTKKSIIPPEIYNEIITTSSQCIFYSLKIFLYCLMIFTQWSEILVRNTANISYSQQLQALEYLPIVLKIMSVLAIFFVSFGLQKIIEQIYIKFQAKAKESRQSSLELKELEEERIPIIVQKKEQKIQSIHPILSRFVPISLTFFLFIRVILFQKIYSYLMAVDMKELYTKSKIEKQFQSYAYGAFVLTAIAFKIMKQVIASYSQARFTQKEEPELQIYESSENGNSPKTECFEQINGEEEDYGENSALKTDSEV